MAEQEVGLLHQQLRAARQALAKAQIDNRKLWQQQDTQVFGAPECGHEKGHCGHWQQSQESPSI